MDMQEASESISLSIDLRSLKSWVSQHLAADSVLRQVVLSQRDVVDAEEYAVKVADWLQLLHIPASHLGGS